MTLVVPTSIEEAVGHLATEGARCLAGGQSLVAMMNAGLVAPTVLVSLRGIAALQRLDEDEHGLHLGAMVPHAAVARHAPRSASAALLVETAGKIGHPAIRNQGTIGGSVCHADPAADYPTALTCAEAVLTVVGPKGRREIKAGDFFSGFYETALAPGDILVAVDVPPAPANAHAAYEKFAQIHGDFATIAVAAIIGMEGDRCSFARLAIGACAAAPVRVLDAERRLEGSALDDAALKEAGEMLKAACDPLDDFRGSAAFRLKLVPRMVSRAVRAALAKREAAYA